MNCKETRKWMSPYLDSELGSTKTFEVSEHLRTCPVCTSRFEAERRADQVIRTRLSDETMPDELWARITDTVSTRPWVRVLHSRRYWAMAACVLLAVTGVLTFRPPSRIQDAPQVVRQFVAETPGNRSFAVTDSGDGLDALNSFLKGSLELVFSGESEIAAMGHKGFQVVSTTQRTDTDGRDYVEVRLNCCGEPVLLVLAESTKGDWPSVFEQIAEIRPGAAPQSIAGVNVGVRDIGDVRIVATSRHEVRQVLAGLNRLNA